MFERPLINESFTIEKEKRICRELYDVVRKHDPEGLGDVGFYMGLALGLRSGTFLCKGLIEHAGDVQRVLSNHGVETLVNPSTGVIASTVALRKRLHSDTKLAKSLGWGNVTPEEAVQQTTTDATRLSERFGFLFGFPTDSIRGYAEEELLMRSGVPPLFIPETADLPLWNKKERAVLQKLKPLFSQELPLEDTGMALHQYDELMKEREARTCARVPLTTNRSRKFSCRKFRRARPGNIHRRRFCIIPSATNKNY